MLSLRAFGELFGVGWPNMPDWGLILPISTVARVRSVALSGLGATLLFSAIEGIEREYNWTNNGSRLTPAEWDEISSAIEGLKGDLMTNQMIGVVISYVGSTPSDNWLPCDGGFFSSGDYPELYAVIDDVFKVAGGFNTPDYRRRVSVGSDTTLTLGMTGGEESHTLTIDEIPSHTHTYTQPIISDLDFEDIGVPQPAAGINPIPANTGPAGGNTAHNNMQPYLIVNKWIIAR